MADLVFAPDLTVQDRVLLENLSSDIARQLNGQPEALDEVPSGSPAKLVQAVPALSLTEQHVRADHDALDRDAHDLAAIKALNDPTSSLFEPTIFSAYDLRNLKLHPFLDRYLFKPYVRWAQSIVRNPTDVVMLNHLLLYSSTSVPSALWLFHRFSYIHGILHLVMTGSYVGPYTLLMHQHIHMRGVLAKRFPLSIIDRLFPYITDPLMGHTWNSYYYHHLKHHHVEGNGPSDLSSTIRYQRDELSHFLHYVGRFLLFVWIELPFYFLRKGQTWIALRVAFSEGMYMFLLATILLKTDWRPTLFVFVLPLVCLRIGLMVGNFGQHAFIDPDAPESDFGSSITLIDVASNRYCYNDGYHTSHHQNPRRHWRDHPHSFLAQKGTYAEEKALVFHNIDYIMITVRLMMKDYDTLAKCLVPIGEQIHMSMEERIELLKSRTRKFSEDEIELHFGKPKTG